MGRPSLYTEELAEAICSRLEQGESLNAICKDEGMPSESGVRRWACEDYKGFAAKYMRARELGYLRLADELLDIADNGRNDWMMRRGEDDAGWVANGEHMQRSRLRVDTRKWLLSKMLPKVYGEKVEIDTPADGGIAKAATVTMAALAALAERK